jgi:Holliday junction resolvase RusA-like endonuclease
MRLVKFIELAPVPEPRQSRRDAWNPRECVIRYREFCDDLNLLFKASELPENYLLVFYLPMPKSWSKKKKTQFYLTPHQQKPDRDNLEKAFLDGLFSKYHNLDGNFDDSHVWDGRTIKLWSNQGAIAVYQIDSILSSLREVYLLG